MIPSDAFLYYRDKGVSYVSTTDTVIPDTKNNRLSQPVTTNQSPLLSDVFSVFLTQGNILYLVFREPLRV